MVLIQLEDEKKHIMLKPNNPISRHLRRKEKHKALKNFKFQNIYDHLTILLVMTNYNYLNYFMQRKSAMKKGPPLKKPSPKDL